MLKKLLFACICILASMHWANAQCPPGGTDGSYSFSGSAPTNTDCSEFVQSPYSVWANEAYFLNDVIEGQTYVVDLCNALEWDATLGVYDENNELIASDNGTESDCGLGAKVTFTAPSSGNYTITVGDPDCLGNETNNGVILVFNNSDDVEPCPSSDELCMLQGTFVSGAPGNLQASEFPFATCPLDWGADENYNPATVFVAIAPTNDNINGPFLVTTSAGATYDVSSGTPVADQTLTLNNNSWGVIGLTQEDLDGGMIMITLSSVSNLQCTSNLELDPSFLSGFAETVCPSPDFMCVASVGTVTPPMTTTLATDETSEAPTVTGQTIEQNYTYLYVLTTDLNPADDITYNILDANNTGVFNMAALGLPEGSYNVHGLSFFGTTEEVNNIIMTGEATSGEDFLQLIAEDEICADLAVPGYVLTVTEAMNPMCQASAGVVTPPTNTTVMLGNLSEVPTVTGETNIAGFSYFYVLTQPTDGVTYNVLTYNLDGAFDFTEYGIGTYNVHGLSLVSADVAFLLTGVSSGSISTAADVTTAINNGDICGDLLIPGYELTVTSTVGIETIDIEMVQLSPIPAKDVVTLDFVAQTGGQATIQIVDLSGKILSEQAHMTQVGQNTVSLNTQTLSSGMYFVLLQQEGQLISKKLVKE